MSRTMKVVFALACAMTAGAADAAMQKGDVVQVASTSELKTRPTSDAQALAPAPAGASATLSVRVSNTSGNWWYVEVDGKKGWLPESALAASAAAPSEPTAAVAEPAVGVPTPPAAPVVPPAPPVEPAPPARAAEPAKPARPARALTAAGSHEIAGAFEYFKDSNDFFDLTVATLYLKYGVCLTDVNEVGVETSYLRASGDGFSSDQYTIAPFYTHNLPSPPSNVVPFFSLGAGISRSDDDDGFSTRGTHFEASAGVRVFAGDDFSVNLAAYFRKSNTEAADFGGFDYDSRTVGVRVGLSGFLR